MAFDAAAAKKAGYSDAEIADYLGQQSKFDVASARKAGYSDAEILGHLGVASAPPSAPRRSVLGEVGAAIGGSVAKLKRDVSEDYNRVTTQKPPANPLAFARRTAEDIGHTARMVGDVAGVAMSPMAGLTEGVLVKPYGRAMSSVTNRPAEGWEGDMRTALMGARPGVMRAPVTAPAPTAAPANALAATVNRFDRAGVTPMLAGNGGKGASTLTNVVAENPIAGGLVRNRLRTAVQQTGESANALASRYGDTRGPQITGENVQAGVTRFARDRDTPTSFAAKSNTRYDDVFGKLDAAMQGKTSPGQRVTVADDQFPQQTVVGGSQIETPATTAALGTIRSGTQSASIGDLIADPTLSKAAKALESAQSAKDMSFGDLRRLRTWTRDAQKNPELRQNIGAANLQRLEGSLTQDIYTNADKLGSPALAHQLRRTDQFYAAGQDRIQSALSSFAGAKSGENAYSRVVSSAGSTASADAQKLLSLKRSLAPDEWGDVAANVVSELGKQGAGASPAGEAGFSVSTFVTNYNKLSPRGRDILFGSLGGGGKKAGQLRAELDNLASVADSLKGIEKGANTSKTFVNAQAASSVTGLLIPGLREATATGLGAMALTGEMLTNPAIVRWLSRIGTAQRSPKAMSATVQQLRLAARANAALLPLYRQTTLMLEAPKVATPAAATPQQQSNQ